MPLFRVSLRRSALVGWSLTALLGATISPATEVLSFEAAALPACLEPTATARPTAERAKYGAQSLRWDWQPGDALAFHQTIEFKALTLGAPNNALSTFVVWIYSPKRRPGEALRFEFGRGGARDCWFEFGLDFTGWRTCWVAFERDMQGRPLAGMDTLRIVAPAAARGGTVFIDSLVVSQPIDARHHTRDWQVPTAGTCQPTDANDHWLGLHRFAQQPLPATPVPADAVLAVRTITQRYEQLVARPVAPTPALLEKLRLRFATWDIRRMPTGVKGRTVAYTHERVAYPAGSIEQEHFAALETGLPDACRLLLDLAQAYRGATDTAQATELRGMFLDLTDHLLDQGWAEGSGMGTVHHLGYSTQNFYAPFFLMRDVLRSTGRLDTVQRALAWFSGVGKAYVPLDSVNGVSIDTLNTTLHGQIAALLLIDDETVRARALATTSRWLGRALENSRGLNGGIKADGAILHHANHYPAYAEGGIRGAAQALWLFGNTSLRVPEPGHTSLRRAMLNLRFHSNVLQWPLSLAGRHPGGEYSLSSEPYRFLALAGTPDGRDTLDLEVAAAWKRLALAEQASAAPGKKAAATEVAPAIPAWVEPELPPTGHLTLNYGTLAAHRRGDWLVTARGHSRYLWGSEVYPGANVFGRYLAYGHVEILATGSPISLFDSGFAEAGWDWNCWPGTTAIHLPLDRLRNRVNNLDAFSGFEEMLLSDEAFAGGSNLGGRDGMFAMKLHEHAKYDGSHRARKSVFFFDDRVVLVGSDIANGDREHETRTTLFQQRLRDQSVTVIVDDQPALAAFPAHLDRAAAAGTSLTDTVGNAYFVLSDSALRLAKTTQVSRTQNDKRDTRGDFLLAWLDHGAAPTAAGYAYAILVQPSVARRQAFAAELRQPERAPFVIHRRDRSAHIVRDRATGILAAACFEPCADTGVEIAAVDTPALVMLRRDGNAATLSVCDPDLHLYAGTEPDQLNADGSQREVSIYSRKWFRAASAPSRVRVTLAGDYTLSAAHPSVSIVAGSPGRTVLEFTCQDALPVEVSLVLALDNKQAAAK